MPARKVKKKPDQPNSEEQAESSKNYSKTERDLLRQLVQARKHVVENKKADAVSNQRKTQAWQKVTDAFNAQGQSKRSIAVSIFNRDEILFRSCQFQLLL